MMDIKRVSVGLQVYNNAFGEGVVREIIDKKEERLFVEFNNSVKTINASFIYEIFKEEQIVIHAKHGRGIVLEYQGNNKYYILFYSGYEGVMSGEEIEPENEIKQTQDINSTSEQIESFRIIPNNYNEQASFSPATKRLLRFFKDVYSAGIATIKPYEESGGNVGVLIVPNKGIVVYKMMSLEEKNSSLLYDEMFFAYCKGELERFRAFYANKMLMSKKLYWCDLSNTQKCFKYPTRFVLIFENISLKKINTKLLKVIDKNIYFQNTETLFENNELFSNFEQYIKNSFKKIDSDLYGLIVSRVVPEYSTIVDFVPVEKSDNPKRKGVLHYVPITGEEREFKALSLEDDQIKIINDTKPGHYITLANPGTGKSVLLVSKAYRVSSMNKDSKVLITCFNNNLMQHHSEFAVLNGLTRDNFYIKTFHQIIVRTLKEKGILTIYSLEGDYMSSEFCHAIDVFEENLDSGKISLSFDAIFIDEVQLFEPRWIDLCYKMLNKDNKDTIFELFGDMNQNVREKQLKRKAPWQQLKIAPSFKNRYKKLEKNYRNTATIAKYLNSLIIDFNDFLSKKGITNNDEDVGMTTVFSDRIGEKVTVAISSQTNYSRIATLIKEMVKNGKAQYSDFAIIFPATKIKGHFDFFDKLIEALGNHKIHYDLIFGDISTRKKIFECTGVVLTTVDSSLGLDFKRVVFCGLHYWDFYFNPDTHRFTRNYSLELLSDNQNALETFSEIGKKIYSACSRAKESLLIMDDLDKDSPIKQIIRPKNGREYFNDK